MLLLPLNQRDDFWENTRHNFMKYSLYRSHGSCYIDFWIKIININIV